MRSSNVEKMLNTLGYSSEHLAQNYSVQIDGTSAIKFDYVAFSDRYLKDISTSCIAVQEIANEIEEKNYVEGAKYLAVPVMVVLKQNHVRIWNISPQKSKILADDEDKIIQLYFEKNRFEFMSDTLINIKMGYKQLDIFEVAGLIDFSRAATCKILSEEFERGLIAAKRFLKTQKNINGQDLNNITSITMHLISALIINGKVNPNHSVPCVSELLKDLSQKYEDYFNDKIMLKYGENLLECIFESLNKTINYQSVDHELLGYFYESTLLQLSEKRAEVIRKEFGIYYTPKVLSQEIAQSIPFENIPIEKRFVLDGTCGSGSLLLSACNRLEKLVSGEKKEFDRHNYLTKMIQGYDIDKFASEVARLSLLLYSLPYGNKWDIKSGDLLRINDKLIRTPYIVLGNPPYEEIRANGEKNQKATAFLDKYLSWLHEDGYIGIILPESFLQNDSSEKQREKLLRDFDLLELWMLPGQIFENNCATIVIIAQKRKTEKENLTKVKVLVRNQKAIKNYLKNNTWSFEFFEKSQNEWRNNLKSQISVSPINNVLKKMIHGKKTIGDITDNVMGIMLPSDYEFSKMQFDDYVPYITDANNFQKYCASAKMDENIVYLNYHMSKDEEEQIKKGYAGLRLRKNYEALYAATDKVLVKMSSTPGEIECINAFVDEKGYYPSHSFFAIVSKDSRVSNMVLCMLINSKLVNAYVRKACVKRTLTTKAVRSIPIPDFHDSQIMQLENCYMNIKAAYETKDVLRIKELREKADDIIYDAFELEQNERCQVDELFQTYTQLEEGKEKKNVELENYHNVSGRVEEVYIDEMRCKICLAEFGEIKIQISTSMPGWFLREGAEFSAKYHDKKLVDIRPLVYSYLSDAEVITRLTNEFQE